MNMKKTLMRLGVLAAALALTFVFVSCAQPTEEGSSGPNAPTIIRLYLDRDDATLHSGNIVEIRVGEDLLVRTPYDTFPYPAEVDSANVQENAGRDDSVALQTADRSRVTAIPGGRPVDDATVLKFNDPKKKYLVSGLISINGQITADTGGTGVVSGAAGTSIQVDPKGIYYIDIPLVNQTVASVDRGSIFSGSISGYVELNANTTTGPNQLAQQTYLYTKDKHGFNDLWKIDNGAPRWKTTNSNIKKVSLKPGINEIYLSYFSFQRSAN
jgi:hypothetical protein